MVSVGISLNLIVIRTNHVLAGGDMVLEGAIEVRVPVSAEAPNTSHRCEYIVSRGFCESTAILIERKSDISGMQSIKFP